MSHNFYPNLPVAGGMFANPNAGASSLSEGNSSPSNSGPPPTSASIVPQVDLDDLFKDYYFGLDGQIRLGGEGPGLVNQVGKPLDDAAPSHDAPGQENISYAPAPSSLLIGEQQTQKPPSEMQDLHRDKRGEIRERQQGKKKGKDDEDERQKIERRERNREHAKRSRLRKKFLLSSLQDQVTSLQHENGKLKSIIKRELPGKSKALLKEGTGKEGDGDMYKPLPTPSGFGPVKTLMEPDFHLMSALSSSQQNFAISDPSLPDNPIVYVSSGFLELTGYDLDQVLGRNCRFLQGPGTDQSAVDVIRRGVKEGIDTSVCLLNYKKDGTPFWNQFFVAALRDAKGNVVNFVGVQCEVTRVKVDGTVS